MGAQKSLKVTLRKFKKEDLRHLNEWAKRIRSEIYMSRCRPMNQTATAYNPEQGLLWFVIQVSGSDVGTIWLEYYAQSDEAVLGIFLGGGVALRFGNRRKGNKYGLGKGAKAALLSQSHTQCSQEQRASNCLLQKMQVCACGVRDQENSNWR